MRILYTVQRYGEEIVGGSEAACRAFAEELVRSGHHVEVLTSCARDYVTWDNVYPSGTSNLNGVVVHRLPVSAPRDPEVFGPLDRRLMTDEGRPFMYENLRWNQQMGPNLQGQAGWLLDNYRRFDVAIIMTYLYATATLSIPILFGRIPVVFQPTAHTEPALRANVFEYLFRMVDSFLFFTPEEQLIVEQRLRRTATGLVAGIGIDTRPNVAEWDPLRERLEITNPYLVYVGRIDPMKGVRELAGFFSEMTRLRPNREIDLVLVGEQVAEIANDCPRIRFTGYLQPEEKHAVIRHSTALVQPSYFESFSIVLCEGWVQERPVLVQGKCSVLRGQVERSQGGIAFEGFAEFEQAVEIIMNHEIADALGRNGLTYVEDQYQWPVVISRVEEAIDLAQRNFKTRHN